MKLKIRDESVEISGYVNAVGRESRPLRDSEGYFTEEIEPGAFARALLRGKRQMLLNHDKERVIGSEGENLELHEDGVGLYANADVTDAEVVEKARKNRLRGWSFGFLPLKVRMGERNGMRHRVVEDMELVEVSVIDQRKAPAYAATSVFTRDSGDVETRTMEFQEVSSEDAREAFDYTPYIAIVNELKA